ncbi:MAG TPA: crotonyl-CoA carboxylase/reductase [Solirubrobacteraceae bacterium]|jgi:crotonyl-CoA reductase|nr:crotonyl-CoA carboxylase/reductase [Solirubrobacteraceae bacterium]
MLKSDRDRLPNPGDGGISDAALGHDTKPAVSGDRRAGDLASALAREADAQALLECELPDSYIGAYLDRDDIEMFKDVSDKDVRRSIRVGEVSLPKLAPDEALVGVMASAINYNTVWSAMFEPIPTFRFLERLARNGGWEARHDLPQHVIGSDAAGVIVALGDGVRKWSVGDRVVVSPSVIDYQHPASQADGLLAEEALAWGFETNFGGLAHLAVVKVSQLLPKPRHLSWEEAACNTLCAITAYRMLVSPRGAQFKQGDLVLVWGASGGLGAYAVQLIRNGGGIAIGVVGSERKARLLEGIGCDLVLRRDELGLDGLGEVELGKRVGTEIRRHFGEDPHIVFEHVGRKTFGASVYLVRRGGTVVTCGSSTGYRHEYDNRRLWMSVKRIVGSHAANWQEAWEANRLVGLGRIQPTLSQVFPLEEVAQAAREVQLNRHIGKVGVLCLAEHEGQGVEDRSLRESIGEERLRLFRELP